MAAAAAVAPIVPAPASRVSGADDTVRLGIIGCGARGTELMADAQRRRSLASARVGAVCDICEPRKRGGQAFSGAEVLHRWQELVGRKDIDAVMIATPDHWHATMAIAAMECGKDVYCETPMALRLEEAQAFRDCAARTGRMVQIGACEVSERRWSVARELIQAGVIGRPLWCQASGGMLECVPRSSIGLSPEMVDWPAFLGSAPHREFHPDRYLRWRNYWDYSGGIVASAHYSAIAAFLGALGEAFPTRVSAAGGIYAQDGREVPDSFVMTAEYAGGPTLVLASSWAGVGGGSAVIRGTRATLDLDAGAVRITPEYGEDGVKAACLAVDARADHVGDWLASIRSRRPCVCNAELGYRAMVPVCMALEAYRTGRTMGFDDRTGTMFAVPPSVVRV